MQGKTPKYSAVEPSNQKRETRRVRFALSRMASLASHMRSIISAGISTFALSLLFSCILLLQIGCALPRKGMVLLTSAPDTHFAPSLRPISSDWDHRVLKVNVKNADGKPTDPLLGGDATHRHSFGHQHTATSGPAIETAQPLGLQNQGAKGTHVHLIQSQTQSTTSTGDATTVPPSLELLAYILKRSHLHVHPGIIVAFTGLTIPEGWSLCDGTNGTPKMDGLYVVLRKDQRSNTPVGEDDPRHDATHSHTWSVAITDPNVGTNTGFFGGMPGPQSGFSASSLSHLHTATEPLPWQGMTDPDQTPPRPPTIAIRFMMAGPTAKNMPTGALLPYTGDSAPLGWSLWEKWNGVNVASQFLAGASTSNLPGTTYGTPTHTHFVTMTHHILLAQSQDTGTPVANANGPAMAIAAHTHQAETTGSSGTGDKVETGPATSIPPFVSLFFIRKN